MLVKGWSCSPFCTSTGTHRTGDDEKILCCCQALAAGCPSSGSWAQRSIHTSSMSFASGDIALDMEHATGLERYYLQKLTLISTRQWHFPVLHILDDAHASPHGPDCDMKWQEAWLVAWLVLC